MEQIKVEGPQTHPFHRMSSFVGDECANNLQKIGNRMRRKIEYSPWHWSGAEQMHQSVNDNMEELLQIDERLISLDVRGDYCIQDVGIIQPTEVKRKALGLPDVMQNERFVRCLDLIVDNLLLGVKQAADTAGGPEHINTYLTYKLMSSRGHGLDCVRGEEGAAVMRDQVIPSFLASPDGLFKHEKEIFWIIMGVRRQVSGMVLDDASMWNNKLREAALFSQIGDSHVTMGMQSEPDDGFMGLRVRLMNMIPMLLNGPLMVMNAIVFDNLTEKMTAIFKSTPHSLRDWGTDGMIHCTDFSQFEFTQQRSMRHYIADRMYGARTATLAKHIDTLPITGAYSTQMSGKAETVYWTIDRQIAALAEQFSPLNSGTGDTSSMGKVVGAATQLFHTSIALNKDPEEIMGGVSASADCIAAQLNNNSGDDSASNFQLLEGFSYSQAEIRKVASNHAESLEVDRVFDLSLEDPKKYIGQRFHDEGKDNPIVDKCWAVSHDPVSMFTNNIMPEQSASSPIRGVPSIGLHGSISAYRDTIVGGGLMETGEFDNMASFLLDVIDSPWDLNSLKDEADFETKKMMEDLDSQHSVAQLAANLLGLKAVSELDWKMDKGDMLEKLPEEIRNKLWIPFPSSLTKDVSQFVNTTAFSTLN